MAYDAFLKKAKKVTKKTSSKPKVATTPTTKKPTITKPTARKPKKTNNTNIIGPLG